MVGGRSPWNVMEGCIGNLIKEKWAFLSLPVLAWLILSSQGGTTGLLRFVGSICDVVRVASSP